MKLSIKFIAKLDRVPTEAKIAGKLDCCCNHCKKKTFHYLFEFGSRSFIRCLCCDEVWEVEIVAPIAQHTELPRMATQFGGAG